jgi:F0F1-type ATP synthase membrane subunit c/vacuolar-type H+-ATPase subunit K
VTSTVSGASVAVGAAVVGAAVVGAAVVAGELVSSSPQALASTARPIRRPTIIGLPFSRFRILIGFLPGLVYSLRMSDLGHLRSGHLEATAIIEIISWEA